MTTTKSFTIAVLLTAVLLATLTAAQSVEPIWLSPPLAGTYEAEYPELGVWTNTTVGAGARNLLPVVAMDSNKTLWIMHGGSPNFNAFNVWNYNPQTDLYRWVAGPGNSTTDPRNPGELRVPSPDNHPGFVTFTPGSIDHNDNIWFMSTFTHSGELWMFNTTSHYFTRMKGSEQDVDSLTGVFGTLGQPGDDVSPGATNGGCLVVDSQNNLWQIAGFAYAGYKNRIWRFNTTSYQWTFMGGDTGNSNTVTRYDNDPYYGGRLKQGCDIDENDRVWLFGGYGSSNGFVSYNDVWSYDTRTVQWRLEFGSSASINANAFVAAENDFDAGNHPASVENPSFVDRKDGTLMLVNSQKGTNDIWLFHKTLRQWKLVSGDPFNSNPNGNFSHYRTPGSVMPGYLGQYGSAHGLNIEGDVFIYGGGSNGMQYNSIWLIPHDQCSNSTSNNCSSNARCIERDVGYSCECNDGFIGDGFTCQSTLPPVSPNPPSSPSNEPIQSPSDEPLSSPSPLSSSPPSSTPHRKPHVSRGVTIQSSLFIALSLTFALV